VASHLDHSGSETAFIRLELVQTYNQYAYIVGELNKDLWIVNDHAISAVKTQYFPNMSLSADNRHNPIYMDFVFLPALFWVALAIITTTPLGAKATHQHES
jgi:hypothetical protein